MYVRIWLTLKHPVFIKIWRKILDYYYRTKFTVVELLVIAGVLYWLTKKAYFAIIGIASSNGFECGDYFTEK
jgi:hypothetical protein